jgi:hypothetical protein
MSITIGLLVTVASAQINNEIKFDATNSFVAGQATLPAGTYTVKPFQDDPDVLEVAAATGEPSVMVQVLGSNTDLTDKTKKGPQVIFTKYGNKMVLSQIWLHGGSGGNDTNAYVYQFPPSHASAKAAKAGSPTKVAVAAK